MSALDLIELGLLNSDWTKVSEAYRILTGKTVNPPTTEFSSQLTVVLGEDVIDSIKKTVADTVRQYLMNNGAVYDGVPTKIEQRPIYQQTQPSPAQTNGFVDDGTLAVEWVEDSVSMSQKKKPSERRPEVKYVEVECAMCHKKELVHPILAPKRLDPKDDISRYICNQCVPKGRGH